MVPLKYFSNFWRSLEMPLANCKVNLILTCFGNCAIICINVANQNPTFETTETKLYVQVIILSTQNNAKLSPQLKQVLKEQLIKMNIYQNMNYWHKIKIQRVANSNSRLAQIQIQESLS